MRPRRPRRAVEYRRQLKKPSGLDAVVGLDGAIWTFAECVGCGQPFWSDHAQYTYCSDKCNLACQRARTAQRAWDRAPWQYCVICGEPYKETDPRRRQRRQTCSNRSCTGKKAWRTRRANLAKKAVARDDDVTRAT